MKRKSILALVVITVVCGAVFIIYKTHNSIGLDNVTIQNKPPHGWFINRSEHGYTLLTKHEKLANINNTELYAYGEYITVEDMSIEVSPKQWIEQQFQNNDPLVKEKKWSTVHGHTVFEVRSDAGGAMGKILTYYSFKEGKVIIYSLFPLELDGKENSQGIEDIGNMVN